MQRFLSPYDGWLGKSLTNTLIRHPSGDGKTAAFIQLSVVEQSGEKQTIPIVVVVIGSPLRRD